MSEIAEVMTQFAEKVGWYWAIFIALALYVFSVIVGKSPEYMEVVRKRNADIANAEISMLDRLEGLYKEQRHINREQADDFKKYKEETTCKLESMQAVLSEAKRKADIAIEAEERCMKENARLRQQLGLGP